ncbi:helix-turn-helix transcriptional regulator [Clostridium kluyveri]|uniref:helix-turn-helix transcriptional regulator n=1 Tax=Clostridium kluyveri TaxID=1534 RepID=UPI0002EC8427|nr:helix-turn-helix transcriptional regulator [Clostridium kluyveri]
MFRIKEARKNAGLTQQQLADRVNATREYISAIENEHKLPSIPLLKKIAIALNTTVKNLYKDETEPTQKEVV